MSPGPCMRLWGRWASWKPHLLAQRIPREHVAEQVPTATGHPANRVLALTVSPLPSALTSKMGCRVGGLSWSLSPGPALAVGFRPPPLTASGESPSYIARTATMNFRLRPRPGTPPWPATCESGLVG